MDILHGFAVAGQLAASGLGTYLITAAVKAIPQIPVVAGQKGRILAVAGTISGVSSFVVELLNGELDPARAQTYLVAGIGWATTWYIAHATHKIVSNK